MNLFLSVISCLATWHFSWISRDWKDYEIKWLDCAAVKPNHFRLKHDWNILKLIFFVMWMTCEPLLKQLSDFCVIINILFFITVLGKEKFKVMAGNPKLYYFNGRGKMESVRWLLAAAGVEVCFSVFNVKACLWDRSRVFKKEKASQDAVLAIVNWLFSIIKHSYIRHTKPGFKLHVSWAKTL